jgi:hypothetical protein
LPIEIEFVVNLFVVGKQWKGAKDKNKSDLAVL